MNSDYAGRTNDNHNHIELPSLENGSTYTPREATNFVFDSTLF